MEGIKEVTGGKRSAWMMHVKKTMKAHKGMKLGQALKMASKTFKKAKRGGSSVNPALYGSESMGGPGAGAPAVGGRRRGRRGTRKSRTGRK
jgi:hypothetical protein